MFSHTLVGLSCTSHAVCSSLYWWLPQMHLPTPCLALLENYSRAACSHLWVQHLWGLFRPDKSASGLVSHFFQAATLQNKGCDPLHHLYHPQFCLPMTVLSVILLPGCNRAANAEMPREKVVALPLIQAEVRVPGRGCWYTWQCPAEQPHSHFSREAF